LNLKFKGIFLSAVSSLVVVSASAFAMPVNPTVPLDAFRAPSRQLTGVNFDGIVALDNCSGSIVRYETSRDTDQAMIFTNGHCNENGMPAPGTFSLNVASSRQFAILDPATGRSMGALRAEKILYSTMTKTDITLYRLQVTYQDILTKFKVRPLTLSSKVAAPGTPIEVISGYWRRGYACAIDHLVDTLEEGGWTQRNSIRYTDKGCQVIGGTSGSPVIAAGTSVMVGINNTGNMNGEKCTMDNPCEIDANGKMTVQKGASYGQQTALIYSCLDSELRLDLSLPTCRLPGGAQAATPNIRRTDGHHGLRAPVVAHP
jgi:V8-like Glu-specific endopeptidase